MGAKRNGVFLPLAVRPICPCSLLQPLLSSYLILIITSPFRAFVLLKMQALLVFCIRSD